ncbi:MAG: RHS repeat-associated core domain-containing protein [Patescibacteria group bacterium]|jgi:RHS repeat-associated protein
MVFSSNKMTKEKLLKFIFIVPANITDSSSTNTAKTLDFSYDDLHRLTVASSTNAVSGSNYRETYSYSAIGNITNKSDIGNYYYAGDQGSNYANPHAATNINGATYSYDQNGNLTNDGTWTHSWDYNNRLTQSNNGTATTTYQYDQDGNRIKKAETTPTASSTTIYINQYYEVEGQDIRKYIFAGGERVASLIRQTIDINPDCTPPPSGDWTISVSCTFTGKARAQGDVIVNAGAVLTIADHSRLEIDLKNHKLLVRHNGGVLIKKGGTLRQTTEDSLDPEIVNSTAYHHADHLSGANVDTDENGDVLQLLDYYPYGGIRIDEKAGTYENDYKFTGKELDDETGLYYFGARYQNPSIGRFVSIDPVFNDIGTNYDQFNARYGQELEQLLSDPQMLNSYAYARNNPIIYIDPNGNLSWKEAKAYASIVLALAKSYADYKVRQEWQAYKEWSQRNADWIEAHPKEFDAMLMLLSKSPGGSKNFSKGASIGNLKTSLKNINVESFGKTLFKGNIDLKPTLEKILSGELKARDTFRNDKQLLPPQEAGYYKEYVHPTPGSKDAGPQRIIQGKGGEYYYSPDHYKSFTPLN